MKKSFIIITLFIVMTRISFAQCCAGGAGSPIAGGTAQGVLQAGQLELNTNFQVTNSNRFFTGDRRDTLTYFDRFESAYQYFRVAYGLSENFTMSIESGNYFYKRETGLNNDQSRTYKSQGISDLIIFPRYNILNLITPQCRNEITVGLGFKIPLGSYNDSTGRVEPFSGTTYFVTNPQAVQLTTGAQDIIFYSFFLWSYPARNMRFFANALYIKKGWNPLGEKAGDFAGIGLFAGKTFFSSLDLTLQVRGEWMGKMELNKNILLFAYPNYDPEATGYKKVFVAPQISYSKGNFTIYSLIDIPVYQYVTKTQVGTMFQATAGISYRFFASNQETKNIKKGTYYCPMHPTVVSTAKGTCPDCGMALEKK
ncbi:MAG: hypothetical protein K0B15_01100 [Lentimicrobium sp.]|nr:hypothetical protein [Lentimicrobium sp.]